MFLRAGSVKIIKFVVVLFFIYTCYSCQGEDGIEGTGLIKGSAHKGPFLSGSPVSINELNSEGIALSNSIVTETVNDLGEFEFQIPHAGLYQISINERFFNENTGKISDGPLHLNAIVPIDTMQQTTRVNILTHIMRGRVKNLLRDGMRAHDAINQATRELIEGLSPVLMPVATDDFSQLSIYNFSGTQARGNAYLLALSATLNQYAMEKAKARESDFTSELSLLLSTLSSEFAVYGTIVSNELLQDLKLAVRRLDPNKITAHLQQWSRQSVNIVYAVPDINLFIDSDGDGLVNADDPDDDNDGIADEQDLINPYKPDNVLLELELPKTPVKGKVRFASSLDSIAQIRYRINGFTISEVGTPPYTVSWNPYFWADEGMVQLTVQYFHPSGVYVDLTQPVEIPVDPSAANAIDLQPANQSYIHSTDSVLLKWSAGYPPSSSRLQLWDNLGNGEVSIDTNVAQTEFQTPQLAAGLYQWRVQLTLDEQIGPWSPIFEFELDPDPELFVDLSLDTIVAHKDGEPGTATLKWDDKFYLSSKVSNKGTKPATGQFKAYYYLSKDKVLSSDDLLLSISIYLSMDAGGSITRTGTNVLSNMLTNSNNSQITAPGQKQDYYLLGLVDPIGQIEEIDSPNENSGNNFLVGPVITILPPN